VSGGDCGFERQIVILIRRNQVEPRVAIPPIGFVVRQNIEFPRPGAVVFQDYLVVPMEPGGEGTTDFHFERPVMQAWVPKYDPAAVH